MWKKFRTLFTGRNIAPITYSASAEVLKSYQQIEKFVDKIKNKGVKEMVNIEQIRADIEALKELTAEEYCKEQVAQVYAEFEASREQKIHDLEKALEIFSKYEVVEEVPVDEVEQVVEA